MMVRKLGANSNAYHVGACVARADLKLARD